MIINPYRYGGSPGTWTPASLSVPPNIWLNDTSAVTDAGGGACSQWNDISGNGFHFLQGTGGSRPAIVGSGLDSKRIIRFSSDFMKPSNLAAGGMRNVSAGWIFAIYNNTTVDGSPTYRGIIEIDTPVSSTIRAGLFAGTATGANRAGVGGRRLDAEGFDATTSVTVRNNVWVMALGILNYGSNALPLYVDGALDNTQSGMWTGTGNSDNTASASVTLGAAASGATHFFQGDLAEVIQGSGYLLSASDIDKMFGWAAHKWGLEGSLPALHPYKTNPP